VNEILQIDRVKEIKFIDTFHAAEAIYGPYANNGVVLINLYKKVAFNPRIANLKLVKKKNILYGDNFDDD
jgi:hypothetical protein